MTSVVLELERAELEREAAQRSLWLARALGDARGVVAAVERLRVAQAEIHMLTEREL